MSREFWRVSKTDAGELFISVGSVYIAKMLPDATEADARRIVDCIRACHNIFADFDGEEATRLALSIKRAWDAGSD